LGEVNLNAGVRLLNMIHYSEKDGCLTFQVYVVPRASRSEIAGEHNGGLRVRLAAAPVDGAANRELIAVLAKALVFLGVQLKSMPGILPKPNE